MLKECFSVIPEGRGVVPACPKKGGTMGTLAIQEGLIAISSDYDPAPAAYESQANYRAKGKGGRRPPQS